MNETILIPQKDFREFELFCLQYDIAIDEEDYDFGWKEGVNDWPIQEELLSLMEKTTSSDNGVSGGIIYNFDFLKNRFPGLEIFFSREVWTGCNLFEDKDMLKRLILAKRVRAVLQRNNSTKALNSLDYLAEYLIKHLPTIPNLPISFNRDRKNDIYCLMVRIMYLIEISSCYRGFIAIGYADQCLDLIKTFLKPFSKDPDGTGVTPYELIALYNKGQGCYHTDDREKAILEFEKIIVNDNKNKYFEGNIKIGSFTSPDLKLFENIATIPAKLMIAESLIKLQRSNEAQGVINKCISEHGAELSEYKKIRLTVLTLRCEVDQGIYDSDRYRLLQDSINNKKNIDTQIQSLLIEHDLLKIEKELLSNKSSTELGTLVEELGILAEQMVCINDRLKNLNRSVSSNNIEETLSILLWVKGLNIINEFLEVINGFITQENNDNPKTAKIIDKISVYMDINSRNGFHNQASEILEGRSYRVKWEEIRDKYLIFLEQLNTNNNKYLKEIQDVLQKYEIYALKSVLKNPRIKKDSYIQLKYKMRLKMLGKKELMIKSDKIYIKKFLQEQIFNNRESNPECYTSGNHDRCDHYFDLVAERNIDTLSKELYTTQKRTLIKDGVGLMILQRWNSYTPALTISEGGGYYLFRTNGNGNIEKGIAIDPGYDFLRNFFSEGFGVRDINAILVSHDHADHIHDVPAIINLKFEATKNRFKETSNSDGKLNAILSEGSYKRLKGYIIENRTIFKDTEILSYGKSCTIGVFNIEATRAYHEDLSELDGIGFKISIEGFGKIGFSCDTKITDDVIEAYKDCDIVCCHLGSITNPEMKLCDLQNDNNIDCFHYKTKHLHLPGVLKFAKKFAKTDTLLIVSEFGEELRGGLRNSFIKKISEFAGNKKRLAPIIPSDTGLLIDVGKKHILCTCCNNFDKYTFMDYELYGYSERLFPVCINCKKTLSRNQRELLFKKKILAGRSRDIDEIS